MDSFSAECGQSSFSILGSQAFLSHQRIEGLYDSAMDIQDIISKWLVEARTAAGLTGEQLGTKLQLLLPDRKGNTKGNISHWETKKHQPDIEQLIAVSQITNKRLPSELLSFFDPDKAPTELNAARQRKEKLVSASKLIFGDELIELMTLYQQADPEQREFILESARLVEKVRNPRWVRSSNN
jgi:transcriptional regulator with XRE-family HTH domain